MTETVKPALTPHEWVLAKLVATTRGAGGYRVELEDDEEYGDYEPDAEQVATDFPRLAALALRGQPFGFTHEDVAWLRQMSFSSMDWAEAEAHQKWFQSFLSRITSLLPEKK